MSPIGINSRNSSTIFPRGELKFVNLLKQGTGQELGNIMFNQFDFLWKIISTADDLKSNTGQNSDTSKVHI